MDRESPTVLPHGPVMQKADARGPAGPVSRWGTVLGLVLLAVAGGTFTVASLALLAGGRAYVYGEGRWSKAQQEVVFYLDRYAENGEARALAHARRSLRVPLGDMDARKAMEAPSLDRERARKGLLRGQNDVRDIPKMIWMFRSFSDAPYIRDAVAAWVASDEHILALERLADRLEQQWRSPPPDPSEVAAMRRDLGRIDRTLRPLETKFSHSLSEGMRKLELWMGVLGVGLLIVLALAALGLFRWGTRRVRASEAEARALAEELSYHARHDPLTGLANRRTFEHELEGAMREASERGTRHTLAFVDLDRFKRINDTCGHVAGDEALRGVARLLKEHLRTSDVVARLGGDEFGVILRDCPIERGEELLDRARHALGSHAFSFGGHNFELGSSAGVVEIEPGTSDASSVMRAADRACYRAKGQGGGRVQGDVRDTPVHEVEAGSLVR